MEEINKSIEEELLLEQQQEEEIDYASFSKDQLLKALKEIRSVEMKLVKAQFPLIKAAYEQVFSDEKQEALTRFKAEGGVVQDFEYRLDEVSKEFEKITEELEQKLKAFYSQQKELQKQLQKKKEQVVEQLRDIVNSNEVSSQTYKQVKELQQAWKEANEEINANDRELWRNYKALLDIFYNNRSLTFELLDLDRKKNFSVKENLVKQTSDLLNEGSIKEVIAKLNQYHQEWKMVGPVPEEVRESIWEIFKSVTQKVYDHRDALQAAYDKEKEENLAKRLAIIEKLNTLSDSAFTRISEWNDRTKEIAAIQEEWNAIGAVPREKSKEVANQFWGLVKAFFNRKGEFFNSLDEQRAANMKLKEQLCERVEALKEEENFKDTADKIKRLQAEWKKVGPVSKKHSDAIYNRFRAACDYFFDRRKSFFDEKDQEYVANAKSKEELVAKLKALKQTDVDAFKELVLEWDKIGFVPREEKDKLANAYKEVTEAFLANVADGDEKENLEITVELGALKGNPQAGVLIRKKQDKVRAQMATLKDEIYTLKTNIEFFANSKNADGLRAEVDKKVAVAEKEIKELKRKLQLINSFEF